jgi:hypothetical protein
VHRDNPPQIWAWALGAALIVSGCNLDKTPTGSNKAIQGGGSSKPSAPASGEGGPDDPSSLSRAIITPVDHRGPTLPTAIITPPPGILAALCGNGTRDPNEPCDPSVDGCCTADCSRPLPAGMVCRAAEGECDVAEVCNGESGACPTDRVASPELPCRAATGEACDAPEHCNGETKTCPVDVPAREGVVCRPPEPGMPCDAPERCDGVSRACPEASIAIAPAGSPCRPAASACDREETCTGETFDCPADLPASAGSECRAKSGPCDVAEQCDGVSTLCPDDDYLFTETPCRAVSEGSDCDQAEYCTGSSPECPPDAFVASGQVCRGAQGDDCDAEEVCTGDSAVCPPDARLPSGAECRGGLGICSSDTCCPGVTRAIPDGLCRAPGGGKVVFVTDATVAGNVTIAAADKLCSDAARSANLDGAYRAWLSDGQLRAGGAAGRVDEGPYVRVDGLSVAVGLGELLQGAITNGISLTAWGEGRDGGVWTGTAATGEIAMLPSGLQAACANWTSNAATTQGQAGDTTSIASDWTAHEFPTCDQSLPVYCFPAKPPAVAGAIVFVTSRPTFLGDGLFSRESGDRLCNDAATAAKLGHTFVAWMSTSTSDARDRVPDRAYSLLDGRPVASSLADLTDGSITNPINVTELGTALAPVSGQIRVWTGTDASGRAANHCSNWMPSNARDGMLGSFIATDATWTAQGPVGCGGQGYLYCFQSDATGVDRTPSQID